MAHKQAAALCHVYIGQQSSVYRGADRLISLGRSPSDDENLAAAHRHLKTCEWEARMKETSLCDSRALSAIQIFSLRVTATIGDVSAILTGRLNTKILKYVWCRRACRHLEQSVDEVRRAADCATTLAN